MANTVKPRGAWPVQELRRANAYQSGGVVYPGDFVVHNSAGQVVAATATQALLGVALGYASASGLDLLVADHPDQMFAVQSSSASPSAQTELNLNYNIVATAGSSAYKMSRMALDGSATATTATLPLRALFLEKTPLNAIGTNDDVIVIINNHQLKGGTGTVGT